MSYFVLIKKRTSKNWLGAIPTKRGIKLANLRKVIPKTLKSGYVYKIITNFQLRQYLKSKVRRRKK